MILANPVSGNKKGARVASAIKKLLQKYEIDSEIVISEYPKHLTKIAKELSAKNDYRFYSVGGDGTLNEIVTGIIGTNSEIVVIPCGTGNDFIKSISKYMSMRKIISNSINKKSTKTDVIKLNKNRYCINILNAGFDAMVAKNVDYFRNVPFLTGKAKYNLSIFFTLLFNKNFNFRIKTDKNIIKKWAYTLVAVCNGKYYGGGICPVDTASVTDGILNVCLIDSTRVRQKIVLLPKYQKGKHYDLKQVHIDDTKAISIVSKKNFPVSVDGEIIYTNRLKASVMKGAVNIVHIDP